MGHRFGWAVIWTVAFAAAACGAAPAPAPGGTGAHAAQDAADGDAAVSDAPAAVGAGADSAAAGDVVVAPWTPPPVAPPDQGTDVVLGQWLMAAAVPSTDQVGPALDSGQFQMPDPGTKAYGVTWTTVKQPGGALPTKGSASQYAYAAVVLDTPKNLGVVLQIDHAFDAWLGGRRLPADIYGSGALRFAGRLDTGTTVLVVRGRGGQGMSVGLRTTTHRAILSTADMTRPDLRVADGSQRWLGLALVVPGLAAADAAQDITARVIADSHFAATATPLAGLTGGTVTQLAFLLDPKAAPAAPGETWKATLRVDSPSWPESYEVAVDLPTVATDVAYRQTFRSPDDGSVQYYGVRPPVSQGKGQPLVLSLHGAGVDAIGQAGSYHAQPKAYIAAPTNRRPFGFDWEEWGHANAIFALDDAMARFASDPTRVYLTGHSMGGHGTWTVGTHHSDRFRLLGPSAGWGSFYSYTGLKKPTGPVGRARAHSDTLQYLSNLADNAVYVIHGTADDNVPFSEGQAMFDAASKVTSDVAHHWQQGAGHWWDGDASPGADCVDWPELFAWMDARTLDPLRLDFAWKSPGPYYNPRHYWVRVDSALSPMKDVAVTSKKTAQDHVTVTTDNVRSMTVDGKALAGIGIKTVTVDGTDYPVGGAAIAVGPQTGKRVGVHGPYNAAYQKPFAFVYGDGDEASANVAAYFASSWAAIGNGQAAALPLSKVTAAHRAALQLIHIGLPSAKLPMPAEFPFSWSDTGIVLDGGELGDLALQTIYDAGDKLGAAMWAPAGKTWLLYWLVPFSSRSGMPDVFVWDEGGGKGAAFFSPEWTFDPALSSGF